MKRRKIEKIHECPACKRTRTIQLGSGSNNHIVWFNVYCKDCREQFDISIDIDTVYDWRGRL